MQKQVFYRWRDVDYAVPQYLKLKYANRDGLIAGATGTEETVHYRVWQKSF